MAWLHDSYCLVSAIVGHIRQTVKQPSYAVATKFWHSCAASCNGHVRNGRSKLSVKSTWLDHLGSCLKGFITRSDQVMRGSVAGSNEIHLIQVGMEAIIIYADVQVYNVAFL